MAVVVSFLAGDFESMARAALRQLPLADLIELRLDRCGEPPRGKLAEFIQAAKKPVIVSLHGRENRGAFEGTFDQRRRILHAAAEAGAAFVDVDWTLALELGAMPNPRCHRIVSRHDFERTPEDLERFEGEVREVLEEGDLIKLATHADSAEDGLRVLRHLRSARGGLIAFCMGELGSFTRVLCPMFGSAFTYAAPALVGAGAPTDFGGGEALPLTGPGQLRVNELRGLFPPGGVHPGTSVFAVVGAHVRGSLSPHVHNMALKTAQLDAMFVALESRDFDQLLGLLDDACFRGLAVTAPYKQSALARAGAADEVARACGAANTLVREKQGWRASNTDALALKAMLEKLWPFHLNAMRRAAVQSVPPLAGVAAVVLGAGGAARAAVWALSQLGAAVTIAARRKEAAQQLAREMGGRALEIAALEGLDYEILINATPVGSDLEPARAGQAELPLPAAALRPKTLVLDCVYRPLRTPLLLAAQKLGCTAVPGAEWFVRQAAEQFQRFTNTSPNEAVLRAALEHALKSPRA